jgi:OFA family oxalate/formate antiporter-like MFS transporter
MAIELLLGFQYAWGVFDRVLQQENYGFTATQTQAVLAAEIVMFAVTFPLAGWVLHHLGPRWTTFIGGLLYGTALILGGALGHDPRALFWTTGVLFGSGLALAYISPIVTVVKWFPRYKGIATGLVVACYGSSSFFTAAIAKALLSRGMTPFAILTAFGVAAACGVALLSLALVDPPGAADAPKRGRFPKGVLRTGRFWALAAGFFAGTTAGLSILGSIEKIGSTLGAPEWWLAFGVMAFAVGNTSGRIAWGVITEVIGTRASVCAALLAQSACIMSMVFFGANGPVFIVLAVLIGFCYGSNFVLFITDVSRTYGPERVGSVYGLVGLAYVASGFLGAPSAGFSFDHWHSYVPSMRAASVLLVAGAAAFLILCGHPVSETHEPARPENA